ncbi:MULTISPECIES: diaminobutyrate--2-oxoglutarate transaminase [Microbacterium]|uniref:diaminobutyrate--2-oxoglutarate transaminase n=2 Tax=Microbacteriaceae TaxID=85023 RepID=UPI000A0729AC|nr:MULTISPECIES: diaminobutyrate--2-oxoglutarate transaminase [Microbacterium]
MNIFMQLESEVRSYSRSWPVVFDRAVGSLMYDEDGKEYLDFFTGAGALNYGHNNPELKRVLLDYLADDRIVHSLDMFTSARRDFLEALDEVILKPRDLDYKVVFPGPGGANAVEAALKLARKVTGRESVVNFTNAFHGMTLGALSVTGNSLKRGGAGVPLVHATPMPYDDYFDGDYPDFFYFERLLEDSGSGLNTPAAVIVETVQGEGGINAARAEWLRQLAALCKQHEILLIVDDIQMGCGRTGDFFSFEEAGIVPDIVCLSKSISGYGIPMALTLIRPDLDVWQPGEHNGTFRGISPAFATAAAALRRYWSDDELRDSTITKGARVEGWFNTFVARYPQHELIAKGRGLARGLQFPSGELADAVCQAAFERGLLMETSGPEGEVMKILPALTITDVELERGLRIIDESVRAVLGEPDPQAADHTIDHDADRAEGDVADHHNAQSKEHTPA